ncbi:MAG: sodium:solute symporter family protein [Gemmatimonadetes bacterium]|nr:sodium:solute symporter family protein [Gemmatimonadota bacterium]MBT6149908.1 sodium:solute symporter family protein [Gemmatimonadota bacterium]MBT7860232.1 sodium:solute symporter family protein [Gemmatimonadota bacterium]
MAAMIVAGLVFYLLVMLGIGLYASRRVADSADFVVAGRRLGIWLATGTLAATWFGGGLCIGAASAAYSGGFLAVIADPFGAALCLFLAGLFYVRALRRSGVMTVASFFTRRFSKSSGLLASLCTIPAYVGWVAALMVAFGRILQSLAGVEPTMAILLGAAVVLVYTFAGGMWAVTLTDFVQLAVLILGMVILTPMLLADMGGWTALAAQIPVDRFHLYPHDADASTWFSYARDWLVIGLGNLAGQDLIQRSLSSRDDKIAVRSAYYAGLLYVTVGFLPVLLGMAGAVVLPDLADPDLVMMALAQKYLPAAAVVLFSGALVSALLSSADSALLAPASVVGWDLLKHVRPDADERTSLLVSRVAVVVFGLLALVLALHRSSVYDLMVDSWSILLATLFVPLTAGIWWSRANAAGSLASILTGGLAWLVLLPIVEEWPADLLAVPFGLAALIIVSLATATSTPPVPLSDESGQVLTTAERLGI